MPLITFVDAEGRARTVDAEEGRSLMEAARLARVPGILALCGGFCACATCHVYIDEPFLGRLPRPGGREVALLGRVAQRCPNSRLSCQVRVDAGLDGMRVRTPFSQG